MAKRNADLSTQLLVEFLAEVSQRGDAASAMRAAAENAAAALEAEVGAVIVDGALIVVGFPLGRVPEDEILAISRRQAHHIGVPGAGVCTAISVPLDDDAGGVLLVARSGGNFTPEESNLLRGMARTLHLVLVMLRTIDGERMMRERADIHATQNEQLLSSLQERQELLEQLFAIQRAICRRAPLHEVLGLIVSGAKALLRCDVTGLCLTDTAAVSNLQMTESRGVADEVAPKAWQESAAALAIAAEAMAIGGVAAGTYSMAAPVRDHDSVVGALVVGSLSGPFPGTPAQHGTLLAFAEHVSLALTDARTLENMRQANHDSLTGLASRRLFLDRLRQAVAHASREAATMVSVLFMDLDRFKAVNDALGHGAGDLLLIEVARRLESSLRPGDSAGRLGGDEFAVLLPRIADKRHPESVAQRILEALRAPVIIEGQLVLIGASIGIATRACHNNDDAEILLRDADIAMYEAKRAGTGRVATFHPEMRPRRGGRAVPRARGAV